MCSRPTTILCSLLWLVFVLLIYYWIHKPITPDLAQRLGGIALDLLSGGLLVAVGGGLGRYSLNRFFPAWSSTLSCAERVSGEALLGLGFLSVLMFGVGLLSLTTFSIATLMIVLAILTASALAHWLRDVWALCHLRPTNNQEKALLFFIGLNLGMALIMAVAPPTKFDTLTYQLVGAKRWLNIGQFTSLPDSHFFAFPQLMNTLYTGQMALLNGRLTGAAPLHALIGILMLQATAGYTARRLQPKLALFPVALLLSATTIWLQFSIAYVDLATAAYGVLLLIVLDEWRRSRAVGWLILAGIFAGLLMSIKYTTLGWALAGTVYVLVYSVRERAWSRVLVYGAVAALVLAPWLLRNWFFYDNPVYPFGPTTGVWDELHNTWYSNPAEAMLQTDWWLLASLPLSSTFLGIEGGGGYSATLGPLFLLLLPFLLVNWSHLPTAWQGMVRGTGLLILLQTVFWAVSASLSIYGAQTRLVLTMFPPLAILAIVALYTLPRRPINLAWMMNIVVGLVFVLTLINHVAGQRPKAGEPFQGTTAESHFLESRALDYLFATINEKTYLKERLGTHIVAMEALQTLPAASQVLFLWETRTLYCPEPPLTCAEDSILLRWWHARRTIGDGSAAAIIDHWQTQGYTHLLVWETGRQFEFDNNAKITPADKAEWDQVPALLDVIWQYDGDYTLYTLE